jgi:hypothetical protein
VKADDRRAGLEERAQAFAAEQVAGFDVHRECKAADRCLAIGYTELGENEWATLTRGLPPELTACMQCGRDADSQLVWRGPSLIPCAL